MLKIDKEISNVINTGKITIFENVTSFSSVTTSEISYFIKFYTKEARLVLDVLI